MCSKKLLNESVTSHAHLTRTFTLASISVQLVEQNNLHQQQFAKHDAHKFAWNVCLMHYSSHNLLD